MNSSQFYLYLFIQVETTDLHSQHKAHPLEACAGARHHGQRPAGAGERGHVYSVRQRALAGVQVR